MTTTTLRRRKAGYGVVIPPPPVPRYWAFLVDAELTAAIYSDAGAWIEDRGVLGSPGTLTPGGTSAALIRSDDGNRVGDGSLAWRSNDGELTVWDVEGDTSYTYTVTLGDFLSAPVYRSGWLYWFEFPASASGGSWPAWLLRARCDLEGITVETVASFTATADLDSIDFDGPDTVKLAATSGALLCSAAGVDALGSEVEAWILCRCEWDGTNAAAYAGGPSESPSHPQVGLFLALATVAGDAMGTGLNGGNPALCGIVDDVDDLASENRWPATGSWAATSLYNAEFSGDGVTATLYMVDSDFLATMLEAPYTATGGEPAARVTIGDHPTLEFGPSLLYLMS